MSRRYDLTETQCLVKVSVVVDRGPADTNDETLLRRVEKMLDAGRITDAEAADVRAALETGQNPDIAVRDIRRRHARAWLASAVQRERLSEADARAALAAIERGEDPREVLRLHEQGSA